MVEVLKLFHVRPIIAIVVVIQFAQEFLVKLTFLQRGTDGKFCFAIDNRQKRYSFYFANNYQGRQRLVLGMAYSLSRRLARINNRNKNT